MNNEDFYIIVLFVSDQQTKTQRDSLDSDIKQQICFHSQSNIKTQIQTQQLYRVPINTFMYPSTQHNQRHSVFNAVTAEGTKLNN